MPLQEQFGLPRTGRGLDDERCIDGQRLTAIKSFFSLLNPNDRAGVFETGQGGAVFAFSSMAWSGSLSHNGYDNNVSRLTGNILDRFAAAVRSATTAPEVEAARSQVALINSTLIAVLSVVLLVVGGSMAGYVLARVNRAPLGTLRAMYDNERNKAMTPLALLHLGIALDLQGDVVQKASRNDRNLIWMDAPPASVFFEIVTYTCRKAPQAAPAG